MIIRRTLKRDMPNRSRVVAHVELRIADNGERLVGGLSPAFSVTGELYEPHGTWSGAARERNEREPDTGGAIHDEILRAFPKLAPLVALHLSDPDGTPMHAEANGLYFYRTGRGLPGGWTAHYPSEIPRGQTEQNHAYRMACKILRVAEIPLGLVPEDELPEAFRAFVDAQRDQWTREAAEGRALLESLPDTEA